jgi:Sulfotransferase family
MPFQNPPLFLVGAERSGTTLLRLMLSHHSEITFLNEHEFLVDYIEADGQFPDIEIYKANLQKNRIFLNKQVTINPKLNYRELVTSFLVQQLERNKNPYLGATVHRNFNYLRTLWPTCRFIHLIRDPRDVSQSHIKMGWDQTHWHATQKWVEVEQMWEQMEPLLDPKDYINVTYEELTKSPEKTLTEICNWIGVCFNQATLDYPNTSTYSSPNPDAIQRWKRTLTTKEIQHVESKCAKLLLKRNYELSGHPTIQLNYMEKTFLNITNRYKKALFRIKRYGFPLFLQSALIKRLPSESWNKALREKIWAIDSKYIK